MVSQRFGSSSATIEWVGRRFWPNGALSWFAIEQNGKRIYFSSETGGLVFGSKHSTQAIYERLAAR